MRFDRRADCVWGSKIHPASVAFSTIPHVVGRLAEGGNLGPRFGVKQRADTHSSLADCWTGRSAGLSPLEFFGRKSHEMVLRFTAAVAHQASRSDEPAKLAYGGQRMADSQQVVLGSPLILQQRTRRECINCPFRAPKATF